MTARKSIEAYTEGEDAFQVNPDLDIDHAAVEIKLAEFKSIGAQMDKSVKKLATSIEHIMNGQGPEMLDHHDVASRLKPGQIIAKHKLEESIESLDRFLNDVLEGRRGNNIDQTNQELKVLFASDSCELLELMRADTERARTLLTFISPDSRDARFDNIITHIEAIAEVLTAVFRMQGQLQKARAKAQGEVERVLTDTEIFELLVECDEAEDHGQAVDRIFNHFAGDADSIAGPGYDAIVEVTTTYVDYENQNRADRLAAKFGTDPSKWLAPKETVREVVKKYLDPNEDQSITRDEAKTGIQLAINDIDPPKEVRRRSDLVLAEFCNGGPIPKIYYPGDRVETLKATGDWVLAEVKHTNPDGTIVLVTEDGHHKEVDRDDRDTHIREYIG